MTTLPTIHLHEEDGDFDVYLCPDAARDNLSQDDCPHSPRDGAILIGQICQGRSLTDLRSVFTEFQFVPDAITADIAPVRRSLSASREDARDYARTYRA